MSGQNIIYNTDQKEKYRNILSYNIKQLFSQFPRHVEIRGDKKYIKLDAGYDISRKIEKLTGWFYTGAVLYFDNKELYQRSLKDILWLKQRLKQIDRGEDLT